VFAPLVIVVYESLSYPQSLLGTAQMILESQKTCGSWRVFLNFLEGSFITRDKSAHLSQTCKTLLIIAEPMYHDKNPDAS